MRLLRSLVLLTLLLVACGRAEGIDRPDVSGRKVKVVATIGMIGDIVANIGGDRIELETLMGAGVDPHLYKATERDVVAIGSADIIFFNGLHLEAAMAEVLERTTTALTFSVGEEVPEAQRLSPPEFDGQYDPHIWFDVGLWIEAAEGVRDALIELDPTHAEVYESNADRYLAELEELDGYVAEKAAEVPQDQRVLISAHDAFNYFGEAYDFEVRGLQGISTASEAGTGDVSDLAEFIATNEIPAIFVESSVPRRTIEAVQAAVQARGFDVEIGGELFADAMGDAGTFEGTYIGMVTHNIDTIVNALLGR